MAETERSRLAELDEDAAIELENPDQAHAYVGQYRRDASSGCLSTAAGARPDRRTSGLR